MSIPRAFCEEPGAGDFKSAALAQAENENAVPFMERHGMSHGFGPAVTLLLF
jgi:hypothetical protein